MGCLEKWVYQSGNVWVLSHGWDGGLGTMRSIATKIGNENPTDIVLALDWREVSHTVTPHQSATWTEATSIKVREALNNWNFTDNTKLKLVGHSMGTILNAEIGLRFGKASYSMLLDNPASYGMDYKVNKNGKNKTPFNQTATVSHSITGSRSPAGDVTFGLTADVPIVLSYDNRNALDGDWNGHVQNTYDAMQVTERLQGDILSNKDQTKKDSWSNFVVPTLGTDGILTNPTQPKAILAMQASDKVSRGEVGYLEYRDYANRRLTILRK